MPDVPMASAALDVRRDRARSRRSLGDV